jgi:hypothetical protein
MIPAAISTPLRSAWSFLRSDVRRGQPEIWQGKHHIGGHSERFPERDGIEPGDLGDEK